MCVFLLSCQQEIIREEEQDSEENSLYLNPISTLLHIMSASIKWKDKQAEITLLYIRGDAEESASFSNSDELVYIHKCCESVKV